MNSRDRVFAALQCKIPDRVPTFELVIDSQVIDAIVPGADLLELVDRMGLDAVVVRPDMKRTEVEKDVFVDERGTMVRRTTQDYLEPINTIIKNERDLRNFEFPDPYASHRFERLKKAVERFRGRVPVVIFLRDGWSEVRDLHGFSESLIDLIDNPSLIRAMIEKAVDYYSELGDVGRQTGSGDRLIGGRFGGEQRAIHVAPARRRDHLPGDEAIVRQLASLRPVRNEAFGR